MEKNYVSCHGKRMPYFEGGEGRPLVFLHDETGGVEDSPFLSRLAESFHVIAPIHPGFDEAERPDWVEDMEDMAYYYVDFLSELAIHRPILTGESLGGWIAAELAVDYSDRLSQLVLINSLGLKLPGVDYPDVFRLRPAALASLRCFRPDWQEALGKEPEGIALEYYYKNREMFARLAWSPRMHHPKLRRKIARITAPTLILWGKENRVAPPSLAVAWQEGIAGASLVVLEDCGHAATSEQGEQVALEMSRICLQG